MGGAPFGGSAFPTPEAAGRGETPEAAPTGRSTLDARAVATGGGDEGRRGVSGGRMGVVTLALGALGSPGRSGFVRVPAGTFGAGGRPPLAAPVGTGGDLRSLTVVFNARDAALEGGGGEDGRLSSPGPLGRQGAGATERPSRAGGFFAVASFPGRGGGSVGARGAAVWGSGGGPGRFAGKGGGRLGLGDGAPGSRKPAGKCRSGFVACPSFASSSRSPIRRTIPDRQGRS